MANEMPSATRYTGLTRTVLEYSEAFSFIIEKARASTLVEADWAIFDSLVDTNGYERLGMFTEPKTEVIGWSTYKGYITQWGGESRWEGTLRNVTEANGRVILELEERCHLATGLNVANTVTIYEFNDAAKIRHLEVYVMPLD